MRRWFLAVTFLLLSVAVPAGAASTKLAWNPSTNPKVVGYRIHYGAERRKYTQSVQVEGRLKTEGIVENLEDGKTYFFAVTSYDAKGKESAYSVEISNDPTQNQTKLRPAKSVNRAGPRKGSKSNSRSTPHEVEKTKSQESQTNGAQTSPPPPKMAPRRVAKTSEGKILPLKILPKNP